MARIYCTLRISDVLQFWLTMVYCECIIDSFGSFQLMGFESRAIYLTGNL